MVTSKPDRFPILRNYRHGPEWTTQPRRTSVPWALLAPHERQAMRNHSQSLERLADRGGLGPDEMLAILHGEAWKPMTEADADAQLEAIVVAWESVGSESPQ